MKDRGRLFQGDDCYVGVKFNKTFTSVIYKSVAIVFRLQSNDYTCKFLTSNGVIEIDP